MHPYNGNFGQKIQSDADKVNPERGFVAKLHYDNPETKDITAVLNETDLTDEGQTITEGITDPDVPRSIRVVANNTDTAGVVVVSGTDIGDNAISETITLDGDTEVEGNKSFKTITSIELPVQTNADDTVKVGTDNKLGLPYKLKLNTVLAAYRGSDLESNDPAVAVDEDNLEENTVKLDSALNGDDVNLVLIV